MLKQAGAIPAANFDELLDSIQLLLFAKSTTQAGIGLVAMSGGPSVVITDAFEQAGLRIPELSEASYQELASFFTVIGGSFRNPLDSGYTIGMGQSTDNLERMLAPRTTHKPTPEMFQPGAAGDIARKKYGEWYTELMRHEWFMNGYHLGYRYDTSPIVAPDGTPAPPLEGRTYTQIARPGARAPHAWIGEGRSTLDLYGKGFVLLRLVAGLGADAPSGESIVRAFAAADPQIFVYEGHMYKKYLETFRYAPAIPPAATTSTPAPLGASAPSTMPTTSPASTPATSVPATRHS